MYSDIKFIQLVVMRLVRSLYLVITNHAISITLQVKAYLSRLVVFITIEYISVLPLLVSQRQS